MKNNKKSLFIKLFLIIVIVVIALYLFITKIVLTTSPTKYDETSIMIGQDIIDLKDSVIIDELENIYLSIDDVGTLWKQDILYNENNKSLTINYDSHEVLLQLDDNKIIVDGNEETISGRMQLSSGKIYLPISDLKDVYNSKISYSAETNIVIIEKDDSNYETAVLKKNSYVKDGTKMFSKSYLKTKKDEKVTILEKNNDNYKIRTKEGIIGYVKAKRIVD